MTKIVINKEFGGFNLSPQAMYFYASLKNLNIQMYIYDVIDKKYKKSSSYIEYGFDIWFCVLEKGIEFPEEADELFIDNNLFNMGNKYRSDPDLIKTVETLQDLAVGEHCEFKIVEIPDDVDWYIFELEGGTEIIKEVSRSWE